MKDKWDNSQVVYSVPCANHPVQYIVQTKRKLGTRIREHEKSCEGDLSGILPDLNNDNGMPHFSTTKYVFSFEDTKILVTERNTFRRKVIKEIHLYNKKESVTKLLQARKLTTSGILF